MKNRRSYVLAKRVSCHREQLECAVYAGYASQRIKNFREAQPMHPLLIAIASFAIAIAPLAAHSQSNYPTKNIRLIVPVSASR